VGLRRGYLEPDDRDHPPSRIPHRTLGKVTHRLYATSYWGKPVSKVTDEVQVLVVEDDRSMRDVVSRMLERNGYGHVVAPDADAARERITGNRSFDLALCDVRLPGESGLDLLPELVSEDRPALMMSGLDDLELARRSLELGAGGYLVKPFSEHDLVISVAGALAQHRRESLTRDELRAELRMSERDTLRRLWRAVEVRSEETSEHLHRMSVYCGQLAAELGFDRGACDLIRLASPVHDVGKIAIPDGILLKPGPLSEEEHQVMRRHTVIGHRILSGSQSELLQLAATIALTHHERVDGQGYPQGLCGDAIPLEGRIAAVADVFDALTSDRVYRPAMSVDETLRTMRAERGRQFDARVLDCLLDLFAHANGSAGVNGKDAR
jgi:cyclic di-GMP phosphodiesterase